MFLGTLLPVFLAEVRRPGFSKQQNHSCCFSAVWGEFCRCLFRRSSLYPFPSDCGNFYFYIFCVSLPGTLLKFSTFSRTLRRCNRNFSFWIWFKKDEIPYYNSSDLFFRDISIELSLGF